MTLTMALMAGCALAFSSSLTVHAATIGQISADKPGYGIATTEAIIYLDSDGKSCVGTLSVGQNIMIIGESGKYYMVQYDTTGKIGYVVKVHMYLEDEDYYLVAKGRDGAAMHVGPNSYDAELVTVPYMKSFAFASDAYGDWYRGVYGTAVGFTLKSETEIYPF